MLKAVEKVVKLQGIIFFFRFKPYSKHLAYFHMKQIHALAGLQLQPFMWEKFHASVKITTPRLAIILSSLPQFHIYVGGGKKKHFRL